VRLVSGSGLGRDVQWVSVVAGGWGRVVLVEEQRSQLGSAADAEFGEERFDVVADGVGRKPEGASDLCDR
jgi:hypothetical protein